MFRKDYILPKKILRCERTEGEEHLLSSKTQMAAFACGCPCKIQPGGWILLDFGLEYNGGVQIICQDMMGKKNARLRIRFGESAMECMSDIGYKGATNDHSVRDQVLLAPWVGILEYGHTGYRFIRIDNCDEVTVSFMQIYGVYEHSGKDILGTFHSSDERLNRIWDVGVRTVYLNNNDLITDGIKRDRLVWIGDMHPESSSILRLFGYDRSVNNSLDYIKRITPPDEWMNGIASYTMWWIKIQHDLYCYSGDKAYLSEQMPYLKACVQTLGNTIREDGSCDIGFKFIDWPSGNDPTAMDCGIFAMMSVALSSAAALFALFNEKACETYCLEKLRVLRRFEPNPNGNKQMGALLVFAGEKDAARMNEELLAVDPLKGLSTFLCYYVMRARAEANDMRGTLNLIRRYYGGMLDLGATTFFEDFDLEWTKGAKPLDSLLAPGEYDVHGDTGGHCYRGYRHSLCHGWSAGVVPFLSEYVLGVRFAAAGCRKVEIRPDLGDLAWAEGSVPTPQGVLNVRVWREKGEVKAEHNDLPGTEIVINKISG